jgi:hypothetical protein
VVRRAAEIKAREEQILGDLRAGRRLDETRRRHGYSR